MIRKRLMVLFAASVAASCGETGSSSSPIDPYVANCVPGACLLELNNDYVGTQGSYPCCFAVGEDNNCDPDIACPPGESCSPCVLYSASGSSLGGGCCLRRDGSAIDAEDAEGCKALIEAAHARDLSCL
jgi:hypothetical protein